MPSGFCQDCGAEIQDGAVGACPHCGSTRGVQPNPGKSPFVAAMLSFFIPGFGQAYCGVLLKGIGVLLAFTGVLSLFTIFDISMSLYLIPLVWLIGIVDAYRTAEEMNTGRVPWTESSMLIFGIFAVVVGIAFFLALMISAFLWIFR